jgi:hypothetical protein
MMVGLGIGFGIVQLGWTDMDAALQTSSAAVVTPAIKYPKKHKKIVKKTDDTPKVMVLSNDDLPKRHRYYATDTPAGSQDTTVPVTTPSGTPRAATPAAAAVPTPTPTNAVDAVAPRIAPTSSPSDVPVPDASAVHSSNDLTKEPPVTPISN